MRNSWLNRGLALLLPLLLLASAALAQAPGTDQPEMADALRQSGKIYVVVLVIVIILSGLLLYLVRLDRKVSRLEREVQERS
ncbi:CcmD family protein [Hymenobacter psoromatis]|uniref:CcmD family protein n=1 Tax=Hymenobacter psoromatis TaxID=1484116 RepID=UPI001CBD8A4A|nr:CcmD family protein [Hymenobacter psoromatis]